ncbi:MAG: hypothetical protein NC204_04370 [Candidatus Amulumruptor caecigallinarius]|nr:hypothetical protein [Candidatus Amulumruptor caecigallinarius]
MTKKIEQTQKETAADAFKGYTIEQLRYHKAMMELKKEFCKAKMLQTINRMRPARSSDSGFKTSKFALATKIASKVFNNLSVLDYVLMGLSIFGTARKGIRLFRGKK